MLKTFKKFLLALIALFAVFAVACTECEKCEECEVCPEQEECPEPEECPTCPGKEDICDECVQEYIKPTEFVLYDETVVLGEPKELMVDDFEPKGAYEGLIWTSSNEEYATVDQNGVVTGVRPGVVEITATSILDSTVSQTVEVQIEDSEIDPAVIVGRELDYVLAQLPVYANASFTWPTAWNTHVQVEFKLDGAVTEGFEYPADLAGDTQFNYQVTVTFDGTPKETTVTIWAVKDLELNSYTRVESAKAAAATLLGTYTRGEEMISGDISLPEFINGVEMNWSTTLKSAISADGVYNRPLDNKAVTLGITCEYGAFSSNANFNVTVKGYNADEKIEYILTEGSLAAFNGKEVNTSLVLPAYDNKFDVALTYTSGNTAIFDNNGKLVAAPAEKTEVVFTVKAVYNISKGQNFEKEFELKVIAVPATAASAAAEAWLQASEFKSEYHFPYGSEKGNVLDVPTSYTAGDVAYAVEWDVKDVQLYSKGDEKEVAVFELKDGKPELVVQYLRYTQVQITGKFVKGEDAANVTLLLNVGISASAANIYSGTWRNTAQKDSSLTVEQGLYDVVNNVSYFDAPLSYAGDNYGGYMWSGYSFAVTTAEGKTYENFVMDYMTCYIREDAEGNLYIDKANIYSGDGGNWGVFFVNTTNKDFVAEVGTYAATGQYYTDTDAEGNPIEITASAGNRTGLTFDGYANGFVADATGKVIVGVGENKFQTALKSTDTAEFTSADGAKYTAPFVVIPAGGYGMSWKYQFYGVGVTAALAPYMVKDAQLTIKHHDVHALSNYEATQALSNLNSAETKIAAGDITANASIETNLKNAIAYYNKINGVAKEKVFTVERLEAAQKAYAKLLDKEIVEFLADTTGEDFLVKLGAFNTRIEALPEAVKEASEKKADFDKAYADYTSVEFEITLDYDGGTEVKYFAYDEKAAVINMFLKELYAHMVAKGAFQKKVVDGALVDDTTLATPTFEEFATSDYWTANYAKYATTILTCYLFTPYTEDGETVNENYQAVIEGSDKFINTPEGQKWITLLDFVDEATRYANGGGQDLWGRAGQKYGAYTLFAKQPNFTEAQNKDHSAVDVTNKGAVIGAYRFAQYIAGVSINANFKTYVPHEVYSTALTAAETTTSIIYKSTAETVELPKAAHKDGFVFAGWFFEDGTAAEVKGSTMSDVVVKAKWLVDYEALIEKYLEKDLTANYYGNGGAGRDYRSAGAKGDVIVQNNNVGLSNIAVVVGNQLFVLPKNALIKLSAAEAKTITEKADLQVYGTDGYAQNTTGLVYDPATGTVKAQNSYGHGALYFNEGQAEIKFVANLTYGRDLNGENFGYERFYFAKQEDGSYKGTVVKATDEVTLKPGDFLWCPMTADRFNSGLTNCNGVKGVVGVLANECTVEIIDMTDLLFALDPVYTVDATVETETAYKFKTLDKAIAAAEAGATINVAAGEYTLSTKLEKSVVIKGVAAEKSIIKMAKDQTGNVIGESVKFENVSIVGEGGGAASPGSYFYAADTAKEVTFKNCIIKDMNSFFKHMDSTTAVVSLVVDGCTISNIGQFFVWNTKTGDVTLVNCTIDSASCGAVDNNAAAFIRARGANSKIYVANNKFVGDLQKSGGLFEAGAEGVTIEVVDNTFQNITKFVRINGGHKVTFGANTYLDAEGKALTEVPATVTGDGVTPGKELGKLTL